MLNGKPIGKHNKRNKMDKMIIDTKHLTIYISTLQIGVGVSFVLEHRELVISLGILEINIR